MSKHTVILNVRLSDVIQALADTYKDAVMDDMDPESDPSFSTTIHALLKDITTYETMRQACKDGFTMVLFPMLSVLDNLECNKTTFAINVKDDNGKILWVISGNDCDW